MYKRQAARAVGRADQVNVLLGRPVQSPNGELVVEISVDPRNEVIGEVTTDHVPAMALIESTRQAALLLAGELHGFTVSNCVPSRWSARFQGFAEPDLPLHCRAAAGTLTRAADGRPALPVNLTLHQGARQIAAVETVVLQDY